MGVEEQPAQEVPRCVFTEVAALERHEAEVPQQVDPRVEEAVFGVERRSGEAAFLAQTALHRRTDVGQRAAEAGGYPAVGGEVAQEDGVAARAAHGRPGLEEHEAEIEAEVELA